METKNNIKMKTRLLKVLRESNGYVSGQELCNIFNVSRTAVWKTINQLKDAGYEIEAVQNKGYQITKYPDTIADYEIESMTCDQIIGREIVYFEETDSTNTRAKELAEAGADHGTVVVAEHQISGKGRRGRQWETPEKSAAAFSVILRPDELLPSHAAMLTLTAGMAVAKAVNDYSGLDTKIKWPNDVVISGKKICGILTEMSAEMEAINYVIVGVGINMNMVEFPDSIKDVATSVRIETGKLVNRAKLTAAVLKEFEFYYNKFIASGDMSELTDEYNDFLINKGRQVLISAPDENYKAEALGIDNEGKLIVKDEEGQTRYIVSGEVSVRGIYGYV